MRGMTMDNRNISGLRAVFLCGGTIIPVLMIGTVLSCGPAIATSSSAAVTVSLACSITGNTTTPHTAEIPNGVDSRGNDYYPDGIGTTTLKVFCNDNEGFSIYAIGYSDNTMGNTYLRDNSLGSTKDILTSTTFSGPNSAWAMKIGAVAGTYAPIIAGSTNDTEKQSGDIDYSDWASIPNIYTRVAYRNSGTDINNTNNPNASGANVTTTYAAYISPTQSAGTYVGQVKYTLVHPASEVSLQPQPTTAGQICYYPNGSKVEGTMGCQSVSSSVTLLASNFSREGYGFAGWSDKYDYSTGAHFYGPQETITLNTADYSGSNPGLSLYAVWVKSAGNLQDFSKVTTVCDGLTQAPTDGTANLSSVSALTDTRDNQTYAIAKLADGKCWMIENLRLDNSATLTTANTNNPLNDGTKVTLKHNYSDTETYNTLSASQDLTATAWCQSNSASCDDQSMLFTGNTTNRKTDSANNDGNIYSYGNYYNWYSATAGRGTYSFRTNNTSVAGDLCPAGWHLPKGGSSANATNSDFWQLGLGTMGAAPSNNSQYTSSETNSAGKTATAAFSSYPNNFVYSGSVYGGSVGSPGSGGYFWSSTAYSSSSAYYLYLYSSYVYPGTNSFNKYYGRTVRCVAPGV